MDCSCPHAKSGYYRKHMAAVMYAVDMEADNLKQRKFRFTDKKPVLRADADHSGRGIRGLARDRRCRRADAHAAADQCGGHGPRGVREHARAAHR